MQQNQLLYINNIQVDLTDDPIPYVLQINDLAQLQSQQANYSKQFKLPLTRRNKAILGFPDDINLNNGLVYTQMPGKYIVDGIEIIGRGFIEIRSVQNGYVNIILIAGNGDFLDKLQYQIYDMGNSLSAASGFGSNKVWAAYNDNVWDVAHVAGSQQKTSGWIWPIIDWGQFLNVSTYDNTMNVLAMRPAFFLHTAIELLVQSTGYTINEAKSCLYNDPVFSNLYLKLLIPCCNSPFAHGTDFQNANNGLGPIYTLLQQCVIQHARTGAISDQSGNVVFDKGILYTAPTRQKFTAKFSFDLYMEGYRGGRNPAEINIHFYVRDNINPDFQAATISFQLDNRATRFVPVGPDIAHFLFTGNLLSFDFELLAGQSIFVEYDFNHVGLNFGDTVGVIQVGGTLQILIDQTTVLYGQNIECERILPDISQIAFLQDTLQGFGLILAANPNDQTITFASFKNIIENIPNALDWTNKCLDIGKEVSFQLQNLNQVNFLRYTADSGIPVSQIPLFYADDQIDINDKTLNPTTIQQDLFVRPWAASRDRPYYGGTAAEILMIDRSVAGGADTFAIGVTPRLLIDEKLDLRTLAGVTGGIQIAFWNGIGNEGIYNPSDPSNVYINDIISVPYFYKPDAPDLQGAAKQLAWKDMAGMPGLRSTYYPEFETILTDTKKVIRYFNLTAADIANFDFLIPIYLRQDNAYYYCNKIDSWVKGNPVKLELIKVG